MKSYDLRPLLILTLAPAAGCTTAMSDAFFAETVADSRQFHQVTRDQIAQHDANQSAQHKVMKPEVSDSIDALKQGFDEQVVALQKRSDQIHSSVAQNAKEIAQAGLLLAARFAGIPVDMPILAAVRGEVLSETSSVMTAVADTHERLSDDMLDLESRVQDDVNTRFADLSSNLRERLAGSTQESLDRLAALQQDEAAFRSALREELQLSPEQIEEFKAMPADQILAMIAASVAAAALLGKTGRSRGHDDIEKLKDAVNEITTAAALEKPSPTATVAAQTARTT